MTLSDFIEGYINKLFVFVFEIFFTKLYTRNFAVYILAHPPAQLKGSHVCAVVIVIVVVVGIILAVISIAC